MRFLTRTFRNVFYVRVGKRYVRLCRLQCSWTVVWWDSRWDGSCKTPAGAGATPTAAAGAADMPPARANRIPTWTSDLHGRYFAWNWTIPVVILATVVATTATLSSNSCKSASFFKTHFPSILWKQFAENDTFLGEVNSYKRALVLRNARQHLSNYSRNTSLRLVETMSRDRFNKQMLPVMHDLADHQYLNYFAVTTY